MPGWKRPRGRVPDRPPDAEAEKFIDDHHDRPFFLYLPHYAVHMPLMAKPELVAKYRAQPHADRPASATRSTRRCSRAWTTSVGRVCCTSSTS